MTRALVFALLVACGSKSEPQADPQVQMAELRATEAEQATRIAHDELDKIERDVAALSKRTEETAGSIAAAQSDADRTTARTQLAQLQSDRAAVRARVQHAIDAAERAKHVGTHHADEGDPVLMAITLRIDDAAKDASALVERGGALSRDLEDLDAKLSAMGSSMTIDQNNADRTVAKSKLKQLQEEQAEMRRRAQGIPIGSSPPPKRTIGVKIAPECMDNPLAKGC